MATEAPLYDLVLLLSADAEDSTRSKILSDVESAISGAGGSVERNDDWGRRPMAYEIRHQPEAEYHLLQFHAPGSLIEELSHTLRITDGVVRHRVIKVRPGTPEAPSSIPVVATPPGAQTGAGPGAHSAAAPTAQATAAPVGEAASAPAGETEASSADESAASADQGATSGEPDAES